jgi:hypothetical protein
LDNSDQKLLTSSTLLAESPGVDLDALFLMTLSAIFSLLFYCLLWDLNAQFENSLEGTNGSKYRDVLVNCADDKLS